MAFIAQWVDEGRRQTKVIFEHRRVLETGKMMKNEASSKKAASVCNFPPELVVENGEGQGKVRVGPRLTT